MPTPGVRSDIDQSADALAPASPLPVNISLLVDATFLAAVLAIGIFRFLILRSAGAPPTIDAGNWLAFGDAILGGSARSSSIVYPPVVPLLTKGFVEMFGLIGGTAALGAIASVGPATGFFFAFRRLGYRLETLPGALLLLGASAVGEATAWGGFPQLIGLGLTPLVLVELDQWIASGSRRHATRSGVYLMALLATTHFIGLAAAVAAALLMITGIPRLRRHPQAGGTRLTSALLIVLPSIWLVPLYLHLAGTFLGASGDFRLLSQLTWSNTLERIEFLYRDFAVFWRIALPLAVATPVLLIKYRRTRLWRLLTATLVTAAALAFLTREGRFLYFATLIVSLATALWLAAIRASPHRVGAHLAARILRAATVRWTVFALVIGLSLWQLFAGARFFESQRDYYAVLTPGLFQGLELVRDQTPPDAVLAVASIRDAPVGWWVEAITGRKTYYASALRWLAYDDELERARIGNRIFTGTFPDPESLAVAQAHGVDYLIIPTRWADYDPGSLNPSVEEWGSLFYSDRDVVIAHLSSHALPGAGP